MTRPYNGAMTADDPHDYVDPEHRARILIDDMLARAGWVVQDYRRVNLLAGPGVAVRELVRNAGHRLAESLEGIGVEIEDAAAPD